MPGEWSKLSEFRQLLIIRALRPDRITNALQNFCEHMMGPSYVNQDAFSPEAVYEESSSATPIFFILFPGYSPSKEMEIFANKRGYSVENGKLCLISMGEGQEKPAEAVLDKYTREGGWVFLDNVHLMQGWIPTLERKLEIAAETAHADFRCFFSAEPINGAPHAKIIPESILQNAIKVTATPARHRPHASHERTAAASAHRPRRSARRPAAPRAAPDALPAPCPSYSTPCTRCRSLTSRPATCAPTCAAPSRPSRQSSATAPPRPPSAWPSAPSSSACASTTRCC
jgi:hypothetical protein